MRQRGSFCIVQLTRWRDQARCSIDPKLPPGRSEATEQIGWILLPPQAWRRRGLLLLMLLSRRLLHLLRQLKMLSLALAAARPRRRAGRHLLRRPHGQQRCRGDA